MAKLREGLDFPIIPEDLDYAEDELSPEIFEYLLFMSSMSELQDECGIDDPIMSRRF